MTKSAVISPQRAAQWLLRSIIGLRPNSSIHAAREDVIDTVQWVWENAEILGIDKRRFAIAGESAGAYFAVATAPR
jgi:acetyl esterase/lipase